MGNHGWRRSLNGEHAKFLKRKEKRERKREKEKREKEKREKRKEKRKMIISVRKIFFCFLIL